MQVKSLEETIEWVKRCPNCHADESEVEIRQVFEPEDFAPAFSEEDIQQEKNPCSTGRSGSKEIAPLALTHPKLV